MPAAARRRARVGTPRCTASNTRHSMQGPGAGLCTPLAGTPRCTRPGLRAAQRAYGLDPYMARVQRACRQGLGLVKPAYCRSSLRHWQALSLYERGKTYCGLLIRRARTADAAHCDAGAGRGVLGQPAHPPQQAVGRAHALTHKAGVRAILLAATHRRKPISKAFPLHTQVKFTASRLD